MQPAVYGNRTKNNAIFMILLMVATPALTLQTGLLEKDLAPEELDNSVRSFSGTTPLPDCSLTDVSVTEVYHDSSSDWIEIYNSCLLYTSPSPRDLSTSRMPSSA